MDFITTCKSVSWSILWWVVPHHWLVCTLIWKTFVEANVEWILIALRIRNCGACPIRYSIILANLQWLFQKKIRWLKPCNISCSRVVHDSCSQVSVTELPCAPRFSNCGCWYTSWDYGPCPKKHAWWGNLYSAATTQKKTRIRRITWCSV